MEDDNPTSTSDQPAGETKAEGGKETFNKYFNLDACTKFGNKIEETVKYFKKSGVALDQAVDRIIHVLEKTNFVDNDAESLAYFNEFIETMKNTMNTLGKINTFFETSIVHVTTYVMEVYKAGEELKLFDK